MSPIRENKVSQEKDDTLNSDTPEPLSNHQPKYIHPSYMIHAKKVSLGKELDREISATRIMTKSTGKLGRCPGKMNICQKKKVSPVSSTAEILEAA